MGVSRRSELWLVTVALALAGCVAPGASPAPDAPPHHRPGGFRNVPEAQGSGVLDFLGDRLRLALFAEAPGSAEALPGEAALAGWHALGGGDGAMWLGHASLLLRLGGVTVLVDPVLRPRASPFGFLGPRRIVPPALETEELPRVDVILVTHDHYDHLEIPTVERVAARDNARCLLPLRVGSLRDIACPQREEMDWGEVREFGGVRFTFLAAQHESGRGLLDRDATLWGAWLIEHAGRRIYIGGDSGYGPHFARAGQAHGPIGLAFLSVGGFHPREANERVHMDPEEAVRAFLDLRAERMAILHWGTFPMGTEHNGHTPALVRALAEQRGIAPDRLVVPRIGETIRY